MMFLVHFDMFLVDSRVDTSQFLVLRSGFAPDFPAPGDADPGALWNAVASWTKCCFRHGKHSGETP